MITPNRTYLEITEDLLSVEETLNEHLANFITAANMFIKEMDTPAGYQSLVKLLSSLNDYSRSHFIYQESIMELKYYPGESEHKIEHLEFITGVAKLFKELLLRKKKHYLSESSKLDDHKLLLEDTYSFILNWYNEHILLTDKHFNDFLKFEWSKK